MESHEDAKLNELSKEEMWDVARKLRPEMTREEFDESWERFVEFKRLKEAS